MKGFGDLYKSRKKGNKKTKLSKDQIIREAFKFHSQGKILEAAQYSMTQHGIGCHSIADQITP